MKKIALCAIVLISGTIAFGQRSSVPGFRNLVWGVHKDSVMKDGQSLKFIKDKEASEPNAFYLKDERLVVGAAKLTRVNYYFNEDKRFKKVVLKGDTSYYADMLFIVKSKFGKAGENTKMGGLKMLVWRDGDVTVRLSKNKNAKEFTFMIESNWDMSERFVKNLKVKDIPYDGKTVKGFRHIDWLTHKDSIYLNGELQSFTLEEEADQPNTYFLSNDNYSIGTARLSAINYVFNEDDKFNKVVMKGDGKYYDEMLTILTAKFGQSGDISTFSSEISIAEWSAKDTNIKLTLGDGGKTFICIIETRKDVTERMEKNKNAWDSDL